MTLTSVPRRLSSVTGWREVGRATWERAGIGPPVELRLTAGLPPWTSTDNIKFRLDVGPLPIGASAAQKKRAAELHLQALPQRATWLWTDGSVEGGVENGGAGVYIDYPDGTSQEIRQAAGSLCSSYRAEMVALRAATEYILEHPAHTEDPVVFCTDSSPPW